MSVAIERQITRKVTSEYDGLIFYRTHNKGKENYFEMKEICLRERSCFALLLLRIVEPQGHS